MTDGLSGPISLITLKLPLAKGPQPRGSGAPWATPIVAGLPPLCWTLGLPGH